jgi:hypothetical protein
VSQRQARESAPLLQGTCTVTGSRYVTNAAPCSRRRGGAKRGEVRWTHLMPLQDDAGFLHPRHHRWHEYQLLAYRWCRMRHALNGP